MNIDNYLNYPEETTTEVELTDQEIIDLVTHEVEDAEERNRSRKCRRG